jgi:hypothetical protein
MNHPYQTIAESAGAFWPQRAARIAGVLYVIIIILGAFAELAVRQRFVVANDPGATASNILANLQLFRLGFAAEVLGAIVIVPLIVLLYELLKVVNRRVALLAVLFSTIGTAIQALALLGHFAPIVLLTRGAAMGVDMRLLQAQAYMALQLQGIGYAIALALFGGTMLARGYLIVRSAIVPRVIGAVMMIEGVAYWANSFVDFLVPGLASTVLGILMVTAVAEVALALWLLVMGVNVNRWYEWRQRPQAV